MKKPEITPGPWVIDGEDIIGNDTNGYICTWSGRTLNARAISAVPDMIDALIDSHGTTKSHLMEWGFFTHKEMLTDDLYKKQYQALTKAGVEL